MAFPLHHTARRHGSDEAERSLSVYRERPAAAAAARAALCTWEGLTGWRRSLRLLPDAAVDLVWTGEALIIEPPQPEAIRRTTPPSRRRLGLRLRPGAAAAILGAPMSDLGSGPVQLRDLWGAHAAEIEDQLAEGERGERVFERLVIARLARGAAPDTRVEAALHRLRRPGARVEAVADQVGLTPRDLRRRFELEVGLAPKAFQRIARFRHVLAALRKPDADLAQIAVAAGYADQAHMTHDVRRLSGSTPGALLA